MKWFDIAATSLLKKAYNQAHSQAICLNFKLSEAKDPKNNDLILMKIYDRKMIA